MNKTTNLTIRTELDSEQYVNKDTGELLSSEHPEAKLKLHKDTGLVDKKYDSFTITNDEALEVIDQHYSNAESNRVIKMTRMVNDCTNVLKQQDDVPHSTETLMNILGYSRAAFYVFIRKLIWHDIVHVTIRNVDNKIIKTIVLNPHIARRSKIQHGLTLAFKDISKGLDKIVIEELPKFPTKVNSK